MGEVLPWLEKTKVDVLLMQETKVVDDLFPEESFAERGFQVSFSGQKTYNGVAIASRFPIEDVITDVPDWVDPERRILAATIQGIRVVNLYVPNGAAVGADKYHYKLRWLSKVTTFLHHQLVQYPKLLVAGDFNIAPKDLDVHAPLEWEGSVLVSAAERDAFDKILSLGLTDSFRQCHPDATEYSWWDYRAASFRRNRGLRIDHILLSEPLVSRCVDSQIDKEPRGAERPSDHAPVWVGLDEGSQMKDSAIDLNS